MKVCPSCGSINVTIRIPQMEIWICKDCWWEGIGIMELPEFPDNAFDKIEEIEKIGKEEKEEIEDEEK